MKSLQGPAVGMTPLQFAGTSALPDGGSHNATSDYCYTEELPRFLRQRIERGVAAPSGVRFKFIAVWAKGGSAMYAAIRQGKARAGMVEELTRRIKEGAIPIISDVEGFMAYYVVYAPDDTVTAISLFNGYAGAEEANRRALAWIEQDLAPLLDGPATALAGPVIVHTLA